MVDLLHLLRAADEAVAILLARERVVGRTGRAALKLLALQVGARGRGAAGVGARPGAQDVSSRGRDVCQWVGARQAPAPALAATARRRCASRRAEPTRGTRWQPACRQRAALTDTGRRVGGALHSGTAVCLESPPGKSEAPNFARQANSTAGSSTAHHVATRRTCHPFSPAATAGSSYLHRAQSALKPRQRGLPALLQSTLCLGGHDSVSGRGGGGGWRLARQRGGKYILSQRGSTSPSLLLGDVMALRAGVALLARSSTAAGLARVAGTGRGGAAAATAAAPPARSAPAAAAAPSSSLPFSTSSALRAAGSGGG